MKRNLMSVFQQRSRSTFLKCRAPCAAARSLAANRRSLPRGPPTAAPPALWGAASPPSAPAGPLAALPTAAAPNRAGQAPWPQILSSARSSLQYQPPAACNLLNLSDVNLVPLDTSGLSEPTTG